MINIASKNSMSLLMLSNNFALVWNAEDTPIKERKRMLRLLIADITLKRTESGIEVHIRFAGGQTKSLLLPLPKNVTEIRKTNPDTIKLIRELAKKHTDSEIVQILNNGDHKPFCMEKFTLVSIQSIRHNYGIKSYYDELRNNGMCTRQELAADLNVTTSTISHWYKYGLLKGLRTDAKGTFLFEKSQDTSLLIKTPGCRISKRVVTERQLEQHEALS